MQAATSNGNKLTNRMLELCMIRRSQSLDTRGGLARGRWEGGEIRRDKDGKGGGGGGRGGRFG